MKYKKLCFLIFSTGVKCRTTSLAGCSHFSKVLRPLWSSQATNGDSRKWVILIRVRNSCLLPSHFSYRRNLLWCNKRGTRKRSEQWFKSRSMHRENKIKIYCCTWKSLMERWKQCVMWFIRQPPNKQRCLWLFWSHNGRRQPPQEQAVFPWSLSSGDGGCFCLAWKPCC